jgi:hypothetical protein
MLGSLWSVPPDNDSPEEEESLERQMVSGV